MHTTGPVSALVELQDGRVVRRHQDHLRRIQNPTEPEMSVPEADPQPKQPTHNLELTKVH